MYKNQKSKDKKQINSKIQKDKNQTPADSIIPDRKAPKSK